jgi:hypothetical protein
MDSPAVNGRKYICLAIASLQGIPSAGESCLAACMDAHKKYFFPDPKQGSLRPFLGHFS